jgi:hypothetical protein
MADIGGAAALFARYLALLEKAGYHETKTWPYAYDYFDNGAPIPDLARELYRNLGDAVKRFGDPFRTAASESFFHWLKGAPGMMGNLGRAIYERRPDLQNAFPDPDGVDREGLKAWMRNYGAAEHQIPPEFLPT